MSLTIELPVRPDQTAFNLKRWDEVLAEPHYAKLDGTFETDRFGHVLHMPPPSFQHGRLQRHLATTLERLMSGGETVTECPVSTPDGVKGIDVVWLTDRQLAKAGNHSCLPFAPSICVEIKSPGNTPAELSEKKALYFAAGATEVWICDEEGKISFFASSSADDTMESSLLCPDFPGSIALD